MATVWLVHVGSQPNRDLALGLIGDFALRAFGSLKTMELLVRMTKKLPEALIVDCPNASLLNTDVLERIEKIAANIPKFVMGCQIEGVEKAAVPELKLNYMFVDPWTPIHELSFVIKSALRSTRSGADSGKHRIRFHNIEIDQDQNELHFVETGSVETLTPKETRILSLLILSPGGSISRDDLKKSVWRNLKVSDRNMDSHISRIRTKLSGSDCVIESVYGAGYCIK